MFKTLIGNKENASLRYVFNFLDDIQLELAFAFYWQWKEQGYSVKLFNGNV